MAKASLSVGTKVWAEKIAAAWQSSIDGIFATGRTLANAKLSVPRGDFERMIESELPFSAQTARKLMSIANDKRLSEGAHVRALPPHWGTLYELTKLKDEQFDQAIKEGIIRPDMERKDVPRPLHVVPQPKSTVIDVEHEDITESPAAGVSQADPGDAVPAPLPAQTSAVAVTESTADDESQPSVVTTDSEGMGQESVNIQNKHRHHFESSEDVGEESVFDPEPGVHTPEAVAIVVTPEHYIRDGLAWLHIGFKALGGKAAARLYDGPFSFDEINAICDNMISFTDEFEKVESGTSVPEAAA